MPVVYRGRKAPDAPPHVTLDALDHPIFSWAEMEHCRVTGDKGRIALVYEPLKHYQQALNTYLRQGNGLYMTDWASMDNSQRNPYLDQGGCGVDISSEMVMFDRDLAAMADMLGKKDEALQFRKEADETAALINKLMWDPDKNFYFDLTLEGKRAPVKTVAGFWPLIAGVCTQRAGRAPGRPIEESARRSPGCIACPPWPPTSRATTRRANTGAVRSGRRPIRW